MMNKKEKEQFKFLMARYKRQWDANQYNRTNYDEDLEYYVGHRNQEKYPLAYNHVFNRILPIVHTILSRFMDQLYQTSNIVSVKPRKKRDINNANSVEAVLNFQLENLNSIDMQGGSYLTMLKWFFNTITFGKGIAKCYWKKEERISPRRMLLPKPNFDRFGNFQGMDTIDHISQEMQTVYDGPYVEVLHNKLFTPDPQYKSIQKMGAAFLTYKRSVDYLKRMADKGIYKNINELGWASTGGASSEPMDSDEAFVKSLMLEGSGGFAGILTRAELEDKFKAPEVDVLECYTKLILKDTPYEVGSGVKIKGLEEEVIAHIGNYKTLLSIQRNQYGIRPLFDMGCYMQPEMYWDIGLVRLTKGIQEQINNLGNLRMQNAMMLVSQMIRVDPNSDIDPKALVWRPFGLIPAEKDEIEPITIPDMNSNLFLEQENFYENTIQDLTGMYSYNMGQTPQRQERVGVVHSIQSMGEARVKLMLMSMDYLGIRPLLKYMMLLNTFHLPSGFEYRISTPEGPQQEFAQIFGDDIHCDFDYAARYTAMEPALGKQYRAQNLVQMAQLWNNNPWINQYQWNKVLGELNDIREADRLLKSPQQFQQEMEQQQIAAMKAQQQEVQGKQQLEQTKTQGKMRISEQDFGEDTALADQQFGYDMVLEGIKEETANQKST